MAILSLAVGDDVGGQLSLDLVEHDGLALRLTVAEHAAPILIPLPLLVLLLLLVVGDS